MENSCAADLPQPGTPPLRDRALGAFWELVEVVARLRAPDGCPWDRAQTLATIKPYTLEETYELLEAIDSGTDADLVEELGDLLLQVILFAQIGADAGRFDLVPVLEGITEKMIRRHPHVFGPASAETVEQVRQHWDLAKQQEKQRKSALDGVPLALPALARTARLTAKAARSGTVAEPQHDWPARLQQVFQNVTQLEPPEQNPSIAAPPGDTPPNESAAQAIGEALFQLANLARQLGFNPEELLRNRNRQFEASIREAEGKST